MLQILIILVVVIVVLAIIGVLIGLTYSKLLVKVPQGSALIISKSREIEVTDVGKLVIPIIHKAEMMDISVKTIEIDRRGTEGLICKDNIRADIAVRFYVRVSQEGDAIKQVAQTIGVERASSQSTLEDLFVAKFSEALKSVGKELDFEELYTERSTFRDAIIKTIGKDLNGYSLEDAAIDYLEQTPLAALDENNIFDAEGIRKITEVTAREHVATNIAARDEEKEIKQKDVETIEAVLELEKQQAEAEASQSREVETIKALEQAKTEKVREEQRLLAEQARIDTDRQIAVSEQDRQREEEVAAENRNRVVAIEMEKVARASELEKTATSVQVTQATKEREERRAEIAEIESRRVAVDKQVAEQEEAIATLRVVEAAERESRATVIAATADAEAGMVGTVKESEAETQAATFEAQRMVAIAGAEKEASDLQAAAMIKLAEGDKAKAAAEGLAEVQVKTADAAAIEQVGMAQVRVDKEAAEAIRMQGIARVDVQKGEAEVVREQGQATADAARALLVGEAQGLTEKAAAMAKLDGVGQDFEKWTRELDKSERVEIAGIEANVEAVRAQSEAIGSSLGSANIDIVADPSFIPQVMRSVTAGKAVDAFAEHSGEGREELVENLMGIIGSLDTKSLENLAGAVQGTAIAATAKQVADSVTEKNTPPAPPAG